MDSAYMNIKVLIMKTLCEPTALEEATLSSKWHIQVTPVTITNNNWTLLRLHLLRHDSFLFKTDFRPPFFLYQIPGENVYLCHCTNPSFINPCSRKTHYFFCAWSSQTLIKTDAWSDTSDNNAPPSNESRGKEPLRLEEAVMMWASVNGTAIMCFAVKTIHLIPDLWKVVVAVWGTRADWG